MEQEISYKGYFIKVIVDEDPQDPREWGCMGTMYAKGHRRYTLGDKECDGMTTDMFGSWKETREYIEKKLDAAICLPLGLLDHSGLHMYVGGGGHWSDPGNWDSGTVGFIYISREKIRKEYSVKRISPKLLKRVEDYLRGEVETYNMYLRGEVYGFVIEDPDGEKLDSCWGFYGDPESKGGCIDEAKSQIDYLIKKDIEEWEKQPKKRAAELYTV